MTSFIISGGYAFNLNKVRTSENIGFDYLNFYIASCSPFP